MKTILITLTLLLSSTNSFACSCYSDAARLLRSISEFQNISQDDIQLKNVKARYNLIYMLPNAIRVSVNRDRECELSCSLKGVRLTAKVIYLKDGKTCEAFVIKPAHKEDSVILKNIICH